MQIDTEGGHKVSATGSLSNRQASGARPALLVHSLHDLSIDGTLTNSSVETKRERAVARRSASSQQPLDSFLFYRGKSWEGGDHEGFRGTFVGRVHCVSVRHS